MSIIKKLVFQNIKNSHRKLFYKNLLISECIFFFSIIYFIIILVKGSFLIITALKRNEINIYPFLIYIIIVFSVLDLFMKLLFSQIRISNVYPYLRFNISRKKLATYVILMNHLNARNLVGLLFLIPIIIIGNDSLDIISLVSIFLSLFVIFILNNYVSMMFNFMRLRLHFLVLIPILFSLIIYVTQNKMIVNLFSFSYEIRPQFLLFFILSISLLSIFFHMFLKKELVKMFYLK
jgi:hypothetical protein